jgi:hypothetical protein
MEQNELAVRGKADVELDPATVEFLCFAEPGKSVFRGALGGATMANHQRQDVFEVGLL